MKITNLECLEFGVDDVEGAIQFSTDYGLQRVPSSPAAARMEAQDGTAIEISHRSAAHLAPAFDNPNTLRKTTYGVADAATLAAIAAELGKDRSVRTLPDGAIEAQDDMGFTLGFQVTRRKALNLQPERVNAHGSALQRPANVIAVDEDVRIAPRTLSHVVYFVPDAAKAEAFYVKRLGFFMVDRYLNVGPFLRPAGMTDHHSLFLIQTPPHMKGVEHFTFHFGNVNEVLQAGTRMVDKGYRSFWGPGRHKLGSNWFWYFNSPFSCHMELDADMDQHDERWKPRELKLTEDMAQLFLFEPRPRWMPGPGPAEGPKHD
jgi:catechol 2,3-dioxygenase-like lactoylglutathione lyase family enzyme